MTVDLCKIFALALQEDHSIIKDYLCKIFALALQEDHSIIKDYLKITNIITNHLIILFYLSNHHPYF